MNRCSRRATVVATQEEGRLAKQETRSCLVYSAKVENPNFMPEYSVWKPATSSGPASGRSKGVRFVSSEAAGGVDKEPDKQWEDGEPVHVCAG